MRTTEISLEAHTFETPTRYLWSLTGGARIALFSAMVLSLVTSLMTIFQPRVLQTVVNDAAGGRLRSSSLLVLIVLVVGTSLVTGMGSYLSGAGAETCVRALRERITRRYLALTIGECDRANSADLLARATSDTLVVKQMIVGGFLPTLGAVIMLLGIAIFMVAMDAFLFGVTLAVVAVGFCLVMLVAATAKRASREMQEATGAFSIAIERLLASQRTIKAFNAQEMERRNIDDESRTLWRAGITLARLSAFIQPALNLCLQGAIVMVILTGAIRVNAGTLDLGGLLAYLMYLFLLVSPIATLGQAYTQIQIGYGALTRLRELDAFETEGGEDWDVALAVEVPRQPRRGLLHASSVPLLEFEDVSFGYESQVPTLDRVNLQIRQGQRVCVIGRSGSGKTTLLELVERFHEPDSGRILFDGCDIRALARDQYRSRFALVGQGADVLTGTLRENLTLGDRCHSDERLWEVLDMVGLRDLVGKEEFTLDSDLGQHGTTLSGGQQQRIAWARALLSDADVLLLDEPTSNLDPVTERAVRRLVNSLEEKTIITVTHQLDSVIDADLIILLEEGRVVAQGTHEELLRTSEAYTGLVADRKVLAA